MSNKFLIVFLLFFCGTLCTLSFAEELKLEEGDVPVSLKADRLNFDARAEMVSAEGNVIVVLEGVTIEADRVVIDVVRSVATAEGHVRIERADYHLDGNRLTYLVTSEIAEISNFNTRFKPVQVKGELFIKVGYFKDTGDKKAGGEGTGTTCEYDQPHYDVKASEFEYFPKDKIVAKNVTFYIGPAPLIWLPYYIFDISKRTVTLLFPILGENPVEGRFLKWSIDYFMNRGAWGTIYLDIVEKKGLGKGFLHNFDIWGHGGKLFLYQIEEKDNGRLSGAVKFEDEFLLTPSLGMSVNYNVADAYVVPSGRRDRTDLKWGLSHKREKGGTTLNYIFAGDRIGALDAYTIDFSNSEDKIATRYTYDFKEKFGAGAWFSTNQRFSHSQPIGDKLNLTASANFYRNRLVGSGAIDERLDPALQLDYREDWGTLKLKYSGYLDTDKDSYVGDNNLPYLEYLPEVEIGPASRTLKILDQTIFSLNSALSWGKYHEVRYLPAFAAVRDFTTERTRLAADISRTTPISEGSIKNSLFTGIGAEQYLYTPGDRFYIFRENFRLSSEWFGFYKNDIIYGRGFSDGATPFFFDEQGSRYKNLTDRMVFYYADSLSLTLDSGYNYQTQTFFDNNYNLRIAPDKNIVFNFTTGYDIEKHLYKDFLAAASVIPYLGSKITLNANYNQNSGKMNSASSVLDMDIGDAWAAKWKIKMAHSYDLGRDQLRMRELTVTKDLHCWEASFSYGESKDEKSIFFTIKAFPEQSLGFISGSSGVFFEGFRGLRKETVTRY